MKFGVRQCANIVFRAKQETRIGDKLFHVGQPVLYIDTATTSSLEQAATTVYAQGGRGNARLIAWEGEKTMTFTLTDALLSPIGFHVLSGAGLFRKGNGQDTGETGDLVHFHMNTMAVMTVTGTGDNAVGTIDLTDALIRFGFTGTTGKAAICVTDAPIYIMKVDEDGSIEGDLISGAVTVGEKTEGTITYKGKLSIAKPMIGVGLDKTAVTSSMNVMVDYYIDLPGRNVWEMDVTQNTFGGFYYVEADTLFRQKSTGRDLPANLTFPNVKIQSNFTMTFAATGDPSTFDFTMDAFPGYTYFDKTKEVLCVFQIVDDSYSDTSSIGNPVMYHDASTENNNDYVDYGEDSHVPASS